jgi:hypothetical protein
MTGPGLTIVVVDTSVALNNIMVHMLYNFAMVQL